MRNHGRIAFNIAVAIFLILGALNLARNWFTSEWSKKPSLQEIKFASERIMFPPNVESQVVGSPVDRVSNVFLEKTASINATPESLMRWFRRQAEDNGWTVKSEDMKSTESSMIICSDKISYVISVSPLADGIVKVRVNTYWLANGKDDWACRSIYKPTIDKSL